MIVELRNTENVSFSFIRLPYAQRRLPAEIGIYLGMRSAIFPQKTKNSFSKTKFTHEWLQIIRANNYYFPPFLTL